MRNASSRFAGGWMTSRAALFAGLICLGCAGDLSAQAPPPTQPPPAQPGAQQQRFRGDRTYPQNTYFAVFSDYYDGDYQDALKQFTQEARGGVKMVGARWVDAICYQTMVGESYYQLGQLDKALPHYEAALRVYLANPDWMLRVQFPDTIRDLPPGQARGTPWGQSARAQTWGSYPDSMQIAQGNLNTANDVLKNGGGAIQAPILMSLQVTEIVRCTVLATRRWRELCGPVCPQQQLTKDLLATLARRPGIPNHWSEAWIDVMLGTAYLAAGKDAQARPVLERGVVASGQYTHTLSAAALYELGRLASGIGDQAQADMYFHEASYAAVQYGDPGLLEEIMRAGTTNHITANQKGVWPPLATARAWSRQSNQRVLAASIALDTAECLAAARQPADCQAMLAEANARIGSQRDIFQSRLGARMNYLLAQNEYQRKSPKSGDDALGAAMRFQVTGSLWNFHIRLVDSLFANGGLTARNAVDLYTQLFRDPTPVDWSQQPLESLSTLLLPHDGSLQNWFQAALQRNAHELALEIAELARRDRFYSALPMGGRLLSMRWVLEAPPEALSQQALLERQAIWSHYPEYETLTKDAAALQKELAAQPLVPENDEGLRTLTMQLKKLNELSTQQELLLREIAASREPGQLAFPPRKTADQIKEGLPEKTALLVFYLSGKTYYAFMLYNGKYVHWQIPSPAGVQKQVAGLLHAMGNLDGNRALDAAALADEKWVDRGKDLLKTLLDDGSNFPTSAEEIVIVPDGALWYVPFEALPLPNSQDGSTPLLSKYRIRYAPLASLALSDGRGRRQLGNTAVVAGRLFPRDDAAVALAAAEELAEAVPQTTALKQPLPSTSPIYGSLFHRLIVLDDVALDDNDPLAWRPVQLDKQTSLGALSEWLALPWGGPDEVVLPGYHTAAETSLKKSSGKNPGDEVFLSVCGILASGTRTILMSRWRAGGQSSIDLVREFVRELPRETASQSWQRSALLAMANPIDPGAEPRVNPAGMDQPPNAASPFFWAGYMLVDSGVIPQPADDDPGGGVLKIKPKADPAKDRKPAGDAPADADEAAADDKPAADDPPAADDKKPAAEEEKPADEAGAEKPAGRARSR